ncbi:MAG: hypothetical protein JJ926_11490 [Roseitalea sp.]|uniref:hypothetical protein n=1 Tax=Oceaniradius stylonematis TaxID=2184161 RepID=UPI0013146BFD|nr:hypothetical protein [Oceaniradius stylonematis]MBO6553455.1 hypothetical protein [Roseitalea sp.]MBO6952498.1 hypothetical protein [Rhizobiaceae bacterium]MBO6593016.1 hypothetical protein [Roseitalea sp.]MBO6600242.1 hypothetical protein [Roseitalea sp.]MBO6613634.1 hypothetical protein [Roseitalea sp.]
MGIDPAGADQVLRIRLGALAAIGAVDAGLASPRCLAHRLHRKRDDARPPPVRAGVFPLHPAQCAKANLVVGLDKTVVHGRKSGRFRVG